MRKTGTQHGQITSWKDERGFGFISPSKGGPEVFVHISAFTNRSRRPSVGETVAYQIKKDAHGRVQAAHVSFAGERNRKNKTNAGSGSAGIAFLFAGFYMACVTLLVVAEKLPTVVFTLYAGASVLALIMYAWDKSAARNDRWRTAESTLHLLGLVGGWPGALVARHLFRHKSKKQSFIITFWCTVLLNTAALGWCLTPSGHNFLESLLVTRF